MDNAPVRGTTRRKTMIIYTIVIENYEADEVTVGGVFKTRTRANYEAAVTTDAMAEGWGGAEVIGNAGAYGIHRGGRCLAKLTVHTNELEE